MRIAIPDDDLTLLKKVEALGQQGLTVGEIAERVGLNASTLRFRIRDLGFRFSRRTELETTLGGLPLSDLLSRGELVVAEELAEVAP